MLELSQFKPTKKYFIGVDSDGTAFDSMAIKHTASFIPMIFEIWGMEEHRELIVELEELINLYSKLRGVNRFPGLLFLFEELEARGIWNKNLDAFRAFCNSGKKMSNTALEEFIAENDDELLKEVLQWSRGADRLFSAGTVGLKPYSACISALSAASEVADVVIVSSASAKGLREDWENGGLAPFVTCLCGMEAGSKKEQLKAAAEGRYDKDKILMLGDAPGDMDAAKYIDALFFPIIPKRENESWEEFEKEGLKRFINGEFAGEYENRLASEFNASLPPYAPVK